MTLILKIGGALTLLAGLTFYGFGMNDPNPVRWTALSGVVCLSALIWVWRGAPLHLSKMTLAAFAFLAYAALSLLWSPDWRQGVLSLYNLTILVGLFLSVLHMDRKWLGQAAPVVASLALAVSVAGTIFWPESIGLMGNENFQAEFLCLLVPFCLVGRVTWPETMIGAFCLMTAALAVVILIAVNPSDSKWAAIGGVCGLLLLSLARGYHLRGILILAAAGCAFLWFMLNQRVLTSINQRLELGYNTLLMWLDRPIFGTGLGGFNYLYPDYQEAHIGLIDSRSMHGVWLFAGATHNEYVQALAVFGVVGCIVIAAFIWLALKNRQSDPLANWSLVSLAALAGLSVVNFPLQNPATAAIGAVALALALKPGDKLDLAEVSRSLVRVRPRLCIRRDERSVHQG
jgi:O-antigen ligase